MRMVSLLIYILVFLASQATGSVCSKAIKDFCSLNCKACKNKQEATVVKSIALAQGITCNATTVLDVCPRDHFVTDFLDSLEDAKDKVASKNLKGVNQTDETRKSKPNPKLVTKHPSNTTATGGCPILLLQPLAISDHFRGCAGQYKSVPDLPFSHPIYQHVNAPEVPWNVGRCGRPGKKVYMYFQDGIWAIGPELGNSKKFFFGVKSKASTPAKIRSKGWASFRKGKWHPQNLKVCRSVPPTAQNSKPHIKDQKLTLFLFLLLFFCTKVPPCKSTFSFSFQQHKLVPHTCATHPGTLHWEEASHSRTPLRSLRRLLPTNT